MIWVTPDRLYFSLFVIMCCLFAACNYQVCSAEGWIWLQSSWSSCLVLQCLSSNKLQSIPLNFSQYPVQFLFWLGEKHPKLWPASPPLLSPSDCLSGKALGERLHPPALSWDLTPAPSGHSKTMLAQANSWVFTGVCALHAQHGVFP